MVPFQAPVAGEKELPEEGPSNGETAKGEAFTSGEEREGVWRDFSETNETRRNQKKNWQNDPAELRGSYGRSNSRKPPGRIQGEVMRKGKGGPTDHGNLSATQKRNYKKRRGIMSKGGGNHPWSPNGGERLPGKTTCQSNLVWVGG